MPIGRYRVMDGEGHPAGTEEFRCAPGPAGWRYFSTIETALPEPHREVVDLAVDGAWRPVQVRVDTGRHRVVVWREEDLLVGTRDGDPLELPGGSDVDYLSPCFNAATANRLGRTAEIEVLYLEPVTAEPSLEPQRYELIGQEEVETPVGRFVADRWVYTALRTRWSRSVWVAGDVVVAYEGLYELVEFDPGPRGPRPA